MSPKFRKIAIISGALLMLGGLALGVSLSIYLNSPSFREFALGTVNSQIKGRISLKEHHLALVSGRLTLTDFTLLLPDGTTVADIHHLSIGIFWPALAWRAVDITSLTIDAAQVALHHDAQDRLDLLQALEPSKPSADDSDKSEDNASWQVRLGSVKLQQAKVSYERPAKGLAVTAGRIDATGAGDLIKRSGRLQLEVSELAVKAGEVNEHLAQLTITAAYDDNAELPVLLVLNAPGALVSLKGRIENTTPELQLKASCDLDLDLAQLSPWLSQVEDLTGRLQGRATIKGAVTDPEATVKLGLTDGGAAGIQVNALSLDATMVRRRVILNQLGVLAPWVDLKLTGRVDLQPVFPGNLTQAETDGWDRLPYDLDIRINALKPDRIPRLSSPLHGDWQGDVKLAGVGVSPEQAGARLQASLKVQGFRTVDTDQAAANGSLDVTADWRDQILTVGDLQSTLGNTTLQGRGRMDLKKKEVAGEGRGHTDSLSGLGAIFDIPLPDGAVTLKFSTQGIWPSPATQATLVADGLAMAGWRFGNLKAAAQMDPKGVVTISQLAVENGGGQLAGQGRLMLFDDKGRLRGEPGMQAVLDAAQLQLSDFNDSIPVDLTFNGRLAVDGLLLRPKAVLDFDDTSLQWQELACKASGTASWNDGFLEISRLRLEHGRSALDLSGTSRWRDSRTGVWTADPQVTADISADTLLLEEFLPDIRGAISLQAALRGAVSDPKGEFTLHARDFGTGDQKLADADLQGRLAGNVVHVKSLSVALAPGQQVTGSGWYALDQRFQLALKASNLALAQLPALQQWDAVGGLVDLDFNASGTVEQPQVIAEVLIHAPVINERRFDDFRIDLQLQDRLLTATADLNFKLAGQYRLDSGQFDFSADFNESDLSSFLSMALDGQWAARLSGYVRATGNWHTPAGIEADVALSDAWLDYQEVRLLAFAQLNARLEKGRIALPPTPVQLMQQGQLVLSAEGDLERQLALAAEGVLPLAVIAPFTDIVDRPRGEVRIAAHATGPWDRLQWQADLTAHDAGALLTNLDQTLHGLNGSVRIHPDKVQIEDIAGMLDDGYFSLDGQVQLADGRLDQGTVTVKARALPLQWPDTMDMKISADLTLKGGLQKAGVTGRIVLLEGAYYKRLRYNLLSAITQPQRAKSVGRAKGAAQWQKAVDLNVAIVSRYPFLVDNNVARLEISPDLKLTGTAAAPIISGRAAVTEGDVFFRGRTFNVTQGVVDFVNPYRIEPTLDITAETRIRDYQVSLAVSGTPDNLMIKLDSNQSLSDADILSLILLGRVNGESAEQNGSSGATTGEMLAALMTSVWGDEIKKSTGVDILEIGTATSEDGGNEDITQLTVGKQLTRRLTVKYALESSGEQMVQRAISEYRLLEHILASGFQDTAGKYGGELMFRIEFR